MDLATLGFVVDSSGLIRGTVDMKKLEKQASAVQTATAKMEKQWQQMGKVLGVALAGIATGIGGLYIRNTIQAEKISAKLESRVKALGGAAAVSAKEIRGMAEVLQATSTFDDESITEAATALLAFTNVGADQYARTLATALDLAAASGDDLTTTAEKLGKALNEPEKAARLLREQGIALTDSQRALIKALDDSGQMGAAQGVILTELEKRYKGAALAARNTLGGALEGLKNSFNNLLEGDSGSDGLRGATAAVNDLSNQLNDPELKRGVDSTVAGLVRIAGSALDLIGTLGNAGSALSEFFGSASKRSRQVLENQKIELETRQFGQQRALSNSKMLGPMGAGLTMLNELALDDTDGKLKSINAELDKIARYGDGRTPMKALFSDEGNIPESMLRGTGKSNVGSGAGAIKERTAATKELTTAEKKWLAFQEDMNAIQEVWNDAELEAIQRTQDKADAIDEANKKATKAFEEVNAQIFEQIKFLGMTADEQEVWNNLTWAGVTAESARGKEIAANTQLFQKLREESEYQIELVDSIRGAGKGLIEDFGNGVKPIDAIADAWERVRQKLLSMAAEKFMDQIFGKQGDPAGGSAGGWLNTIMGLFGGMGSGGMGSTGNTAITGDMSDLFGGGLALGGAMRGDRFYQVGERNRPELAHIGGKQYLIPGDQGNVEPIRGQRKSNQVTVNQVIQVQGVVDRRSASQIAQATAVQQRIAVSRNS